MQTLTLGYPFLFAVIPILFLWAHNVSQVAPQAALVSIAASLVGTAAVFAVCRLSMRNAGRAAAVAGLLVILFFLYGRWFDLLWGLNLFAQSRQLHWLLIAFTGCIACGGIAFVVRSDMDFVKNAPAAFGFAAVMLVFSTVQILGSSTGPGSSTAARPAPPVVFADQDPSDLPDIYYIILDGYARADALSAYYGFDNSDFTNYLKSRGFYIAAQSVSNYPITYMSLASSLNLRYLDHVTSQRAEDAVSEKRLYEMIRTHEAGRFLRSRGYRYVHFNTNYGGTEHSEIADITFAHPSAFLKSEFLAVLLRTTMLRAFEPSVANLHLFMFENLKAVPAMREPTFTLSHFLLPHNPYVFDRNGRIRTNVPLGLQWTEKTGGWPAKQDYIEQMIFLNRKVKEIVDDLLANSTHRPIIVIQGDHGSATSFMTDDFTSPASVPFVRERTAILNAYLVPDRIKERLYPSITPVNTFRLLFHELFGADFELLADRSYITWYRAPNELTDVTEQVVARRIHHGD